MEKNIYDIKLLWVKFKYFCIFRKKRDVFTQVPIILRLMDSIWWLRFFLFISAPLDQIDICTLAFASTIYRCSTNRQCRQTTLRRLYKMKIALPRRDRVDGMEITLPRATATRWNWNLCLRSRHSTRRCCVALIYVDVNSTASENETFTK